MLIEVKLPSGSKLKIQPADFETARALFKAVLSEATKTQVSWKGGVDVNQFKDLFCIGFSSDLIEDRLGACMSTVLYNNGKGDLKIDKDTFQDPKAREDYLPVCWEVAKANISPFLKSLYAEFGKIFEILKSIQA